MEKYIKDNKLAGKRWVELNYDLLMCERTLLADLLVFATGEREDNEENRTKLAGIAYDVIGVCEAIIAKVPPEEAAVALVEVRKELATGGEPTEGESGKFALEDLLAACMEASAAR